MFGFLVLFWDFELSVCVTDVSTDAEGDNGGLIGCSLMLKHSTDSLDRILYTLSAFFLSSCS